MYKQLFCIDRKTSRLPQKFCTTLAFGLMAVTKESLKSVCMEVSYMISVLTNSVLIGIFGLDFNNCKYGDGAKI